MAEFHLFAELFQTFDTITKTYVSDMSSKAASEMAPVVTTGLSLSFIAYAILVMRGTVQTPIMELMARTLRISLICGVALGAGVYQGKIANVIQATPDALATALVPGGVQGGTAADLIDTAASNGFEKAGDAFDQISLMEADTLVYAFIGAAIFGSTVLFVAIGGAFLILAKIGVAILAGLGPIFILALLWQPTTRYFEMWVGQVVNMVLLVVLFAASFGLMLKIYGNYASGLAFDGAIDMISAVGGLVILAIAMLVALLQLPQIASSLGGGASMGFINEMRTLAGMGSGASKAAFGSKGPDGKHRPGMVQHAGRAAVGAAKGAAIGGYLASAGIKRAAGYFRGKAA